MAEKLAIIFIGIQASGKSTFYRKYFSELVHINLDTLKKRSKERKLFSKCLENGDSFVVDNTNMTVFDRERYIPLAKENGYEIHGYYFKSYIDECLLRNRKREGLARIPEDGIRMTLARLERPSYDEGFDELYHVSIEDNDFNVEEWKENM
jgi:predicted kinase